VLSCVATQRFSLEKSDEVNVAIPWCRVAPPLHNPQKLQQIIPYVGGDGAGLGREFAMNMGITGQAIRNKEPYTMASVATTDPEHRAELVADWGYTSTQPSISNPPYAQKWPPARPFLCVPAISSNDQPRHKERQARTPPQRLRGIQIREPGVARARGARGVDAPEGIRRQPPASGNEDDEGRVRSEGSGPQSLPRALDATGG
jgi:hypothetical protein